MGHKFIQLVSCSLVLLLAACVTGQKVDVVPNYNLSTAPQEQGAVEGVVAFSLQLNIKDLSCDSSLSFARCRSGIYVLRQDAKTDDPRDGLNAINPFQVDATPEGLYGPATYIAGPLQPRKDMIIWKLPAGRYAIYQWYLGLGNGSVSPKNYPELYEFTVLAGEATYLGRLSLELDLSDRDNLTYTSAITDHRDTEIPKLLEVFPQFSQRTGTVMFQKVRF